jgi:arginine decarboxylase
MAHATLMSPLSILAVYGDITSETTLGRSAVAVGDKLRAFGFEVITARSAPDGVSAILADPLIGCVMVDVDLDKSGGAEAVLRAFRARNDRATGQRIVFEDAPEQLLVTEPNCWVLHPGETWHGFEGLEDGYCMLDPIKVTVVAPGVAPDGSFEQRGIPAAIIAAYLVRHGFEYEKTQDFTILFLFSIGMTKGKWGTLLTTLIKFKEDYDANVELAEILPNLVTSYPDRYASMGLRDLSDEMFDHYKRSNQMHHLQQAFSSLPVPAMVPADAYRRLVRNQVERVRLDEAAQRVVATSVVPYPPGIPMMMPGENTGPADRPYIGYLKALRDWDRRFVGFGHETHGVEVKDGLHYLHCLKQ